MKRIALLFLLSQLMSTSCIINDKSAENYCDVLVIGDGTGAIAAAIQAARSGSRTKLITTLPWLGGMLSSAGVSAIDGNHHMPAGLWGEFRDSLRAHYGGAEKLATGWVSHTQFEPKIADSLLKVIAAAEPYLSILYETKVNDITKVNDQWKLEIENRNTIYSQIIIDGTDLGDVLARVGGPFDIGLDERHSLDPKGHSKNDLIQDFTYTAILKAYEKPRSLSKPADYDSYDFDCACKELCSDASQDAHPCATMMTYAQLPNNKFLINWPIKGNDYYANIINEEPVARQNIYAEAKAKTLAFVYYINNELGFENYDLADDEFPSEDKLPLLPYHRESRRVKGLVRMDTHHILNPYASKLYRTGIAVGDYPLDHHHKEHDFTIEDTFPSIPAYNIPLGCLIPQNTSRLLMADKGISVTHIVNGTTRLQPVVLQLGQAAGLIANTLAKSRGDLNNLPIRAIQSELLAAKGYLVPTYDVGPDDQHFKAIQRILACGILRVEGEPYQWANRSWFYPDSLLSITALSKGISEYNKVVFPSGNYLALNDFMALFKKTITQQQWTDLGLGTLDQKKLLTRREFAVLYDFLFEPFAQPIDINGYLRNDNH